MLRPKVRLQDDATGDDAVHDYAISQRMTLPVCGSCITIARVAASLVDECEALIARVPLL